MNNMEYLKLATDVMLMLSLGWLCLRFLRAPATGAHSARMAELDASLRSMLREAEVSSQGLSEQLQRRKKDLEKLLYDLESTEQRVGRTMTSADERKQGIESHFEKVSTIKQEMASLIEQSQRAVNNLNSVINSSASSVVSPSESRAKTVNTQRPTELLARQVEVAHEPEALPQVPSDKIFSHKEPSPQVVEENQVTFSSSEAPEPPSFEMMVARDANDRGGVATNSMPYAHRPLAKRIERQVRKEPSSQGDMDRSMQNIFAAADEAMRAAKEIQSNDLAEHQASRPREQASVAPVEIPTAPLTKTRERDPRLGVLGGIKRQVQIV